MQSEGNKSRNPIAFFIFPLLGTEVVIITINNHGQGMGHMSRVSVAGALIQEDHRAQES